MLPGKLLNLLVGIPLCQYTTCLWPSLALFTSTDCSSVVENTEFEVCGIDIRRLDGENMRTQSPLLRGIVIDIRVGIGFDQEECRADRQRESHGQQKKPPAPGGAD